MSDPEPLPAPVSPEDELPALLASGLPERFDHAAHARCFAAALAAVEDAAGGDLSRRQPAPATRP